MTDHERETWSWFARWAVIVRAFAIAEREGVPVGPQRLRRARQILDPDATWPMLDALIGHLQQRQEAGDRGVFDAPALMWSEAVSVLRGMAHRVEIPADSARSAVQLVDSPQ